MVFIICLSIGMGWYFSPMQLHYLVSKEIQIDKVEGIAINVFTSHLQNTYEVNDKANIDKITIFFDDIKVRRVIAQPVTFKSPLSKTYYFILTSKNNAVPVYFMDKDYLVVMRHTYKIVNETDLKQIDDIINSLW